jgi:hypothetical protein
MSRVYQECEPVAIVPEASAVAAPAREDQRGEDRGKNTDSAGFTKSSFDTMELELQNFDQPTPRRSLQSEGSLNIRIKGEF